MVGKKCLKYRNKSRKIWLNGLKRIGYKPTLNEVRSFDVGFNMAWGQRNSLDNESLIFIKGNRGGKNVEQHIRKS